MVFVQFYGDLTTANLSRKNIQPFTLNMRITSRKKLLIKAIRQANKDFVNNFVQNAVEQADVANSNSVESNVAGSSKNDVDQLRALRLEFEEVANKSKIPDSPIL